MNYVLPTLDQSHDEHSHQQKSLKQEDSKLLGEGGVEFEVTILDGKGDIMTKGGGG